MTTPNLPIDEVFEKQLAQRQTISNVWRIVFFIAVLIAIFALLSLLYTITRESFGVVAENYINDPDTLAETYLTMEREFDSLTIEDKNVLMQRFFEDNPMLLRILVADYLLDIERTDAEGLRAIINEPIGELFDANGLSYPDELAARPFGDVSDLLTASEYISLLSLNMSEAEIREFAEIEIQDRVLNTAIGQIENPTLNELATEYLGEVPVPPTHFADLTDEQLSEIAAIFFERNEDRLRVIVIDWVLGITREDGDRFRNAAQTPVNEVLADGLYPEAAGDKFFGTNRELDDGTIIERPTGAEYQQILLLNLDQTQLEALVLAEVAQLQVAGSWPLNEAIFNYSEIEAQVEADDDMENAELKFRSWVNLNFLTQPMNTRPELAGIRTAILGSVWMILLTVVIALPLGVGAAIYLEEYAEENTVNRIIQTNINNLAGVPSIIYGILGLVIFVRVMESVTSGGLFGYGDPTTANGRTIISGSLTMSLLILPIIIIAGQEAIRAVPNSIRQAALGLGATQWETIRDHVLPQALPGILTGTILAVSRAIGETAPLIVVGAATYITRNPDGPFSKFTVIPIQIYRWTSEPEDEFRDAAAAAIVVLLMLLLTLNSVAIILRNRFSRRY